MLAMQLLIQNLIYDLSQMFLPWDRMDPDLVKKPRKWDAGNIGRFMVWLGPTGCWLPFSPVAETSGFISPDHS